MVEGQGPLNGCAVDGGAEGPGEDCQVLECDRGASESPIDSSATD